MSIEQEVEGNGLDKMSFRERFSTPEGREAFERQIEEGLRAYSEVVRRVGSAEQRPEFSIAPEVRRAKIY